MCVNKKIRLNQRYTAPLDIKARIPKTMTVPPTVNISHIILSCHFAVRVNLRVAKMVQESSSVTKSSR